ncbi:MAG: beta-ketoacyl-ACP synthase II [Opitutales bacterium]
MPASADRPRVVITGLGVVHALGEGAEPFWQNILAGKSGISRITKFDTGDYTCKVASSLHDFEPAKHMDAKEVKRTDRFVHLAMAAAKMAVEDAQLDVNTLDPWAFGVLVGSGIGGLESVQEQTLRLKERGPKKVSPFMIPSLIANIAGGNIAIEYGAKGPNYCTVSACSSSAHALGEAMHVIQRGEADVMISGGSEAAIVEVGMAGFCTMKAMSTGFNDEPEHASRPFDKDRDGFIMGEGGAILVLENEEHARRRGARIYGELTGYGASCDAHHITSPDPNGDGLANSLQRALKMAGVSPEEVDYINAHGTSTPYNDKFETLAVKKVFGEAAYRTPISSTKSMTGHLLGAAGSLEAVACLLAIRDNVLPPTINYETPDPDCDLDYVPNQPREAKVDVTLSNNLGFGGHNTSLVLRRYR